MATLAPQPAVEAAPDRLDVSRAELYRDDTWQAPFAEIRAKGGIHYNEATDFGPFWSIASYKPIVHIESLPDLFSSQAGGITIADFREGKDDRLLAAVDRHEIGRAPLHERPVFAGVVALARRLHFDHPRPHFRHQQRAIGPGEDAREVDDGDAGERAVNGGGAHGEVPDEGGVRHQDSNDVARALLAHSIPSICRFLGAGGAAAPSSDQ